MITAVKLTSVTVAWHCKCGLSWRFRGTQDGYIVLYDAIRKHLEQGTPHKLLMNPAKRNQVNEATVNASRQRESSKRQDSKE